MTLQDPRSGEVVEKELYVTRKGATPAAEGQMGLIPGSMGQLLHQHCHALLLFYTPGTLSGLVSA